MTQSEFESRFIKARRKFIAADFARLNDMQREAVAATEGPLLILAGAGSGKTTVLINRIANLLRYGRGSDVGCHELPSGIDESDLRFLESCAESRPQTPDDIMRAKRLCAVEPPEPWRIIAITFTNKAADELKARLETMLGPDALDVWASTFHSACVRILRRNGDRLGYDSSFTIYDSSDSQSLMKRILRDLNVDEKQLSHKAVLGEISRAKDAMLSAAAYSEQAAKASDLRRRKIAEAYVEYEKRLSSAGAMDFDDLIYNTVRLLSQHEEVRSYYQRKFRYVLVDEYQDTNNLQYLLASMLAGGSENICVVGDDDQSIYKFRGATIENILSFEKHYSDARVIRLEQNYRSTGHILGAANSVIANNTERKGKNLWTDKAEGEPLTLHVAANEDDEAQYVAGRLLADFARGEAWHDHAVLYRMNAQSNRLEYAFKRAGIPYRVIGGTKFFERAEIKDMLAYLCVIQNPADDLRLTRIINTPARGIGASSVETAAEIAASAGKSLMDVVSSAGSFPELARPAVRMMQFGDMIRELRELSETLPLDEFFDAVTDKTGYLRALEVKPSDENRARAENVGELKSNIISYMKENGENASLAGFLDEVALYTDIDGLDREADCAVMMTMHSAKGLEFPTVFVVGAEEGIFPGIRAIGEPDEMEEERRLCYVALTRARERLYITCAKQRMLFGRTTAGKVSRFVEEIPAEHIDKPAPATSHGFTGTGFSSFGDGRLSFRPRAAAPVAKSAFTASPAKAAAPSLAAGDNVRHTAFGEGVIVNLKPMGGDWLAEIEFKGTGMKRLLLKHAAQYMTKV